jgi:hypothetical protein
MNPQKQTRNTMADPARVVSYVFIGVGVLFLSLTALFFWKDHQESQHSEHLMGHVVRLEINNEGLAAPVVEYRLNGQKKFIVGNVWSSPPSHDVGDEIDLLVIQGDQDQPKAIINDPFDRYFLIGIFAFFGAIFGGIGILIMVFLKD